MSWDLNNSRKRRIKNYDERSLEKYRKESTDYDQTELNFIENNSRNDRNNESSSLLNGYLLGPIFPDIDYALEELRVQFEEKWKKINFGEQVISEYIQFCENKKEFQPAFWHVVNLNLR